MSQDAAEIKWTCARPRVPARGRAGVRACGRAYLRARSMAPGTGCRTARMEPARCTAALVPAPYQAGAHWRRAGHRWAPCVAPGYWTPVAAYQAGGTDAVLETGATAATWRSHAGHRRRRSTRPAVPARCWAPVTARIRPGASAVPGRRYRRGATAATAHRRRCVGVPGAQSCTWHWRTATLGG